MNMVVFSFVACLIGFVLIGVLSFIKAKKTGADYLLASQDIKPWLVALSAVATNNSGYMFIGQIGFTYTVGLYSIWLMIGWIFGDFLMSLIVHKRLRIKTEKEKSLSFAGVLSRWHGTDFKYVRILGGIVTFVFLGIYAAAQLNAGSKALHVLFEWDYSTGAFIGSIIVLLYCLAGGIRASIWTDAAQSFVMIFAMAMMLFISIKQIGGGAEFWGALQNVSPEYMNLFPPGEMYGPVLSAGLFVLGWMFAGMSVIGQPHIMVRFMAMDDPEKITRTRAYYYGWFTLFYAMTILTALAARLLLPEVDAFDAELALPTLAGELLPEILVGLVLAGLFAATISTMDSQILSCTASVTNDLFPNKLSGYLSNKVVTFVIVGAALFIALNGSENVFTLVLTAWSALGSIFAPLLLVYCLGFRPTQTTAVSMMIGGGAAMYLWRMFELNDIIYEAAPGIISGLVIFVIGCGVSSLRERTVK